MTQNADRVLKAVDPDKVHSIVDNVQSLSAKTNSVVDRADKLSPTIRTRSTRRCRTPTSSPRPWPTTRPNVDTTLKNLAEISKSAQPVVAQIQSAAQNADRLLASVDPEQVHALVSNAQTFSQALAESSRQFQGAGARRGDARTSSQRFREPPRHGAHRRRTRC